MRRNPLIPCLLILLLRVSPAPATTESAVFIHLQEGLTANEHHYLETLSEELSAKLSQRGIKSVTKAIADLHGGGASFIANEKVHFYIDAYFEKYTAGVRIKLSLNLTPLAGGNDTAEIKTVIQSYSITLAGEDINEDFTKLGRELKHFFLPVVDMKLGDAGKELLLAHCIWCDPDDEQMERLRRDLTTQYHRYLQSGATDFRFFIKGIEQTEFSLVCSELTEYPMAGAYEHIVSGFLIDGGRKIELYWERPGSLSKPGVVITLPDSTEAKAREIARRILELSPE